MNKNDLFAQVFLDTPRFELPPASYGGSGAVGVSDPFAQAFPDAPVFGVPPNTIFDSDGDGVIDPWDCQPFNPEEDGWFGDAWKRVTSRAKQATRVDYGQAAARRATVRRAASVGTSAARRSVSRRIAPVSRRVRAAVARAPIHVSRERAAERRATVTRAVSAKAAPVTAAVRAAVAKAPIHPSAERAVARRAAAVRGVSAFAAKVSPIGIAAAAPGEPDKPGEARERMIAAGVLKDRPTTLTTGVGGVPGQPDRAGDVHAYVGIPKTPPGSRGGGAPGERSSFWGIKSDLAAERRGKIFEKGVWGAPKQILTGIADLGAKPREKFESRIEAVTARQQAKFQPGTLSDLTTGFSEKMSRVAGVARRFESEDQVAYTPEVMQKYLGAPAQFTVPSVKSVVHGAEEKLGLHAEWIPAPVKTAGWAAKEAVYGAAFSGTAGAVEMVGMVPAGFEAMARRPDIIPAAVGVGLVTLGTGMYHGATTSPTRLVGEFATFGALMKGGGRVVDPFTPKVIRGEGYVGVGIKGRTKAVYETVDVLATPKEFLKSEMMAGRIKGVRHKQFSPEVYAKEGVAPHESWGALHHPSVGQKWFPAEIYVNPKTYINTFMRPLRVAKTKRFFKPYERDIPMKPDFFAERLVRKSHPTHRETLAHELFHYTRPKATEGAILKMERIYAEAPSQKVFTIPKQVKVGHTYTPKPIIGVRTGKFTTPEGVTTTYKGIQVGKGWTPAELTKTYKMESVTGAEGTALSMEKLTQARLGQLRYEHTGFARGKIDPGYFLPEAAKASPKGLPELMTAEKGVVVTGRNLPSVDVIKPPSPPKPTRFYAEVKQPYMKAMDMPLAGSPARMRWVEAGFRKVSYGVKGAPGVKQPRVEITAEPWGYHPTFPPGIAGGTATVPSYLSGYAPKQISTGRYFHPEGAPSSRFHDVEHFLRPTAPKPAVTPTISPRPPAARPTPVIEPVRAAEPGGVLAPEPTAPAQPGVTFAEPVKSPVLEALLGDTKPAKPGVTFAEPVKSPVLEALFGDMKAAESMQTGASCPIFAPSGTPSRLPGTTGAVAPAKEGWWAPETRAPPGKAPARPRPISERLARTRAPGVVPVPLTGRRTVTDPESEYADTGIRTLTPWHVPEFTPAPVGGKKWDERRRWFILPKPDMGHEMEPQPEQRTYIDTDPHPTPTPDTDTATTTEYEDITDTVPDEWRPPPTPPDNIIIDVPLPTPKKSSKEKEEEKRRKPRKKRDPFDWFVQHDMMTLEGFLGGAAKPVSGAFPEPDLGSPAGVRAGGRAKTAGKQPGRPGLLDVPPGW